MRISRQWLADFVDFDDLSLEQFEELITTRVAEVDDVCEVCKPMASAVVVAVSAVKPHPEKDKLKIATIQTGDSEIDVVCGAPNLEVGQLTAYLAPGTQAVKAKGVGGEPDQLITVEKRAIAGVDSAGILVSESELGLTADHSGIFVFSDADKVKPGDLCSSVLGGPDTVLVIDNKSLTHRPDLWSHFGFAREIAAILGRKRTKDADAWADDTTKGEKLLGALGSGKSDWSIEIDPTSQCRRFSGLEFVGASIQPSPLWMRRRLVSVGAGVRNLLVDLSNYVMHDIGQPNHAYDADKLASSKIIVRNASAGEKFLGLDEVERTLTPEDCVIADENGPVALGGVIGGAKCSVGEDTSRLFLESANFDPVQIRTTAKRYAVRTDASNRFEKSQSAYLVPLAIQRFSELICEIDSNVKIQGGVADTFLEKPASVSVSSSYDYIRERLGKDIDDKKIGGIISSLGFGMSEKKGAIDVDVPYYRATRDISIADDLVEEVGRIHGYENIPESAPLIESAAPARSALKAFESRIRDLLCGMGFSESYNYSFFDADNAQQLGYENGDLIELKNPLDANERHMRSTLVAGMLKQFELNARRNAGVCLFELGRSYEKTADAAHDKLSHRIKFENQAAFERRLLCLSYASGQNELELGASLIPPLEQGGDFFAAVSVIRRIVNQITQAPLQLCPIKVSSAEDAIGSAKPSKAGDFGVYKLWMHPYRQATLEVNGQVVGVIAEVRPGAMSELDSRAVIAEIDVELLLEVDDSERHFAPLPKYPDSLFEMSVVMPVRDTFSQLDSLVRKNVDAALLRDMEVISVYEGAPLEEGQKSVSVKLYLGSDQRTLDGEELTAIQDGLMAAVEGSSYSLRR